MIDLSQIKDHAEGIGAESVHAGLESFPASDPMSAKRIS